MTNLSKRGTNKGASLDPDEAFERRQYLKAFLLGMAAILVWRGVWALCDIYLLPDNLTASAVICISIGLVIMIIYGSVNL